MSNDKITKLEEFLEKLSKNDFNIYFLTPESDNGNLVPGTVIQIYTLANTLKKLNYNVAILYQKRAERNLDWMCNEEFKSIKEYSIEERNVVVTPNDIIIIPELFANTLPELRSLSCRKIMLVNSADYILDTLQPAETWLLHGVREAITTSENSLEYIKRLFPNTQVYVINPYINKNIFNKDGLDTIVKEMTIAVNCRNERDLSKIIKEFYLMYPLFSFVNFMDMRGKSQEEFAFDLKKSILSIWVDEIATTGTFPVESIMCGTPVIGIVPYLEPKWMTKANGFWTNDLRNIAPFIGEFISSYLEDTVNSDELNEMDNVNEYFSLERHENDVKSVFHTLVSNRIEEYKEAINKEKTLLSTGTEEQK